MAACSPVQKPLCQQAVTTQTLTQRQKKSHTTANRAQAGYWCNSAGRPGKNGEERWAGQSKVSRSQILNHLYLTNAQYAKKMWCQKHKWGKSEKPHRDWEGGHISLHCFTVHHIDSSMRNLKFTIPAIYNTSHWFFNMSLWLIIFQTNCYKYCSEGPSVKQAIDQEVKEW